jgi:hypothetical protein
MFIGPGDIPWLIVHKSDASVWPYRLKLPEKGPAGGRQRVLQNLRHSLNLVLDDVLV